MMMMFRQVRLKTWAISGARIELLVSRDNFVKDDDDDDGDDDDGDDTDDDDE